VSEAVGHGRLTVARMTYRTDNQAVNTRPAWTRRRSTSSGRNGIHRADEMIE
jgi:hypothetical protein